jgi:ketosteroid isomerase-like protein
MPTADGIPATHAERMLTLARRYNDAFAAGDVETMRACYAPGVVLAQLPSDREIDVDTSLKVVAWLHRKVPDLHVTDQKATATSEGFVLQYVIRGTTASGAPLRSPTCLVATAGPEGITRLEEYFDRAATDAIG